MHFFQESSGEGVFLGVGDYGVNTTIGTQGGVMAVDPLRDLSGMINALAEEATTLICLHQFLAVIGAKLMSRNGILPRNFGSTVGETEGSRQPLSSTSTISLLPMCRIQYL